MVPNWLLFFVFVNAAVDGAGSLGEREICGAGGRVQLRHRVLGASVASLPLRRDEPDSGDALPAFAAVFAAAAAAAVMVVVVVVLCFSASLLEVVMPRLRLR